MEPIKYQNRCILNALNDDCLRAIFESKNLQMEDLCSLGSVCTRFNDIVKPVFASKYKDSEASYSRINSKPLWKIEEYFRVVTHTSFSDGYYTKNIDDFT